MWTIYISMEFVCNLNHYQFINCSDNSNRLLKNACEDLEINWRTDSESYVYLVVLEFALTILTWFYDLVANHGNELINNTFFFRYFWWNMYRKRGGHTWWWPIDLKIFKTKNVNHKMLVNLVPEFGAEMENNYLKVIWC